MPKSVSCKCKKRVSCKCKKEYRVLKASAVKCQWIPSIDTQLTLNFATLKLLLAFSYAVDLVVCCALGVDMFDCVYPTRTAVSGLSAVLPMLTLIRPFTFLFTFFHAQY